MKKRFIVALGMALCLAACNDKDAQEAKTEAPAKAAAAEPAKALTPAEQAKKLLEGVELTPKGIRTIYKDKSYQENNATDLILLEHESPEVRAFVYNRSTRNYSKGDEELAKYVQHLQAEKDPTVLAAGLGSLMNDLKASDDLYKLALAAAKHENAKVRARAAYALSSTNNKSVEGIYDEALKLLNDSDKDVRKTICQRLPEHGNEAIIPELVKILNSNEEKDAEIHDGCLDGLIAMWYDWPFFKSHSEAAYKATLQYFKKKPRGKNNPPWNGFSKLHWGFEKASVEWMKASPYFKAEDVASVMVDVAKDPAVEWLARKSAVDVVVAFGTKKDLEKLNAAIVDTTKFEDRSVKKAVVDAIAKKDEKK